MPRRAEQAKIEAAPAERKREDAKAEAVDRPEIDKAAQ